jgi:hypothetical protein
LSMGLGMGILVIGKIQEKIGLGVTCFFVCVNGVALGQNEEMAIFLFGVGLPPGGRARHYEWTEISARARALETWGFTCW